MSRELFNIMMDRQKTAGPTTYVHIVLDYGVNFDLFDVKVAKGKPGMAMGRMTKTPNDGRAWMTYFEISKLMAFKIYEEVEEDEKEEDSD